jgi:hypothetical protein
MANARHFSFDEGFVGSLACAVVSLDRILPFAQHPDDAMPFRTLFDQLRRLRETIAPPI